MTLCAAGLAITVLLGPSVQPWYYSWALTVAAASVAVVSRRNVLAILAFGSVALTLTTLPEGSSIAGKPGPLLCVAVAAAVAAWSVFARPRASTAEPAADPGSDARSDDAVAAADGRSAPVDAAVRA
jgi:hypothetical protein